MPADFKVFIVENDARDRESQAEEPSSGPQCETLERPPNIDHYRKTIINNVAMSSRPSIADLLNGPSENKAAEKLEIEEEV